MSGARVRLALAILALALGLGAAIMKTPGAAHPRPPAVKPLYKPPSGC
jgi:hypothetical protein